MHDVVQSFAFLLPLHLLLLIPQDMVWNLVTDSFLTHLRHADLQRLPRPVRGVQGELSML